MRYTTRTEYGLICMIYLANHPVADHVTIKELAAEENYPVPYIEKILQALRQAGLVTSQQGNRGGYVLSRKPSEITLKDIIEALEGSTFDIFCQPKTREEIVCNHICLCGAKPIWRKTKDLLDNFYGALTLEMLAKPQAEVQHSIAMAGRG
jgi:Rrf2 family protein